VAEDCVVVESTVDVVDGGVTLVVDTVDVAGDVAGFSVKEDAVGCAGITAVVEVGAGDGQPDIVTSNRINTNRMNEIFFIIFASFSGYIALLLNSLIL
jgi:hypothetical protein